MINRNILRYGLINATPHLPPTTYRRLHSSFSQLPLYSPFLRQDPLIKKISQKSSKPRRMSIFLSNREDCADVAGVLSSIGPLDKLNTTINLAKFALSNPDRELETILGEINFAPGKNETKISRHLFRILSSALPIECVEFQTELVLIHYALFGEKPLPFTELCLDPIIFSPIQAALLNIPTNVRAAFGELLLTDYGFVYCAPTKQLFPYHKKTKFGPLAVYLLSEKTGFEHASFGGLCINGIILSPKSSTDEFAHVLLHSVDLLLFGTLDIDYEFRARLLQILLLGSAEKMIDDCARYLSYTFKIPNSKRPPAPIAILSSLRPSVFDQIETKYHRYQLLGAYKILDEFYFSTKNPLKLARSLLNASYLSLTSPLGPGYFSSMLGLTLDDLLEPFNQQTTSNS